MPDPSCNPYLALAVMLRAGLDGIDQQGRSRPAGEQEHLQDEPPRAASPAHRRPAGEPQRGAGRVREGRARAGDARRAHLPALPRSQARRVGRTTSATSRRGRWTATSACIESGLAAHVCTGGPRRTAEDADADSCSIARRFIAEFRGMLALARTLICIGSGRGGSPEVRTIRQALASPLFGRTLHDSVAALVSRGHGFRCAETAVARRQLLVARVLAPAVAGACASMGSRSISEVQDQPGPVRRQDRDRRRAWSPPRWASRWCRSRSIASATAPTRCW